VWNEGSCGLRAKARIFGRLGRGAAAYWIWASISHGREDEFHDKGHGSIAGVFKRQTPQDGPHIIREGKAGTRNFLISTSRTARASLVSARLAASWWACNRTQRTPRLLVGPGSTCQFCPGKKGPEGTTYIVKRLPLILPVHKHDAVHNDNCQQSISGPSTTLDASHTCNRRQLR
jgi:hypothetical protein